MKLTKTMIKKIIKEELQKLMEEDPYGGNRGDMSATHPGQTDYEPTMKTECDAIWQKFITAKEAYYALGEEVKAAGCIQDGSVRLEGKKKKR